MKGAALLLLAGLVFLATRPVRNPRTLAQLARWQPEHRVLH